MLDSIWCWLLHIWHSRVLPGTCFVLSLCCFLQSCSPSPCSSSDELPDFRLDASSCRYFLLEASTLILAVRLCSVGHGHVLFETNEEQGKVILIARASNRKEIWRAMEHMGLAALAGILLSWVLDFKGLTEYVNLGVICLVAATGVCSMGMAKNTVRAALNLTGGVLCWYLAFEWHTVRGLYTDSPSAFLRAVPAVAQRVWITVVASAFLLLEIDRIKSQATENEAAQLRRGYTGSIVDAACSRAEDEQRIREEIGDQIGAVDYAIEVLMSAGMSTPILREIASKGVSIQQAANPALALPMLMFGPFLAITAFMLVLDAVYLDSFWTWRLVPLRTLTCLERILMIILIRQSPRDERCFDYLVIQKCAVVYLAVFTPPMFQCEMIGKLSYQKDRMWFVIPPVAYTTMFIFVLLGFRRTANLPCGLGPCLVQLFLARDPCVQLAAAGHCIRRKNTAAESPQSSDSESESPCAD